MVVIEKDLDTTVVQFSGEMVDMCVLVVVDVVIVLDVDVVDDV